jgi:hypothetical protein
MAFMDGDYDTFQRLQEQLVLNFGRWITPNDIKGCRCDKTPK